MFEVHRLVKDLETNMVSWQRYYKSNDIDQIYRNIEISNLENNMDLLYNFEVISYRILIDDRVFAFIDTSNYQLDYMRSHYNTNEKCRPRYTSDEYDLGFKKCKTKKKKR